MQTSVVFHFDLLYFSFILLLLGSTVSDQQFLGMTDSATSVTRARVLLVGCGDVGTRTGWLLHRLGYHVTALKRNTTTLPDEFVKVSSDVTDPAKLKRAFSGCSLAYEYVIVTLSTGPPRTEERYEKVYVQGLRNVLNSLTTQCGKPGLVIFVSSTSVYGQDNGELITEESPTEPTKFNGKCLLRAEQLLFNWAREVQANAIVVRFGGIYGSGRSGRLIQQVQQGGSARKAPVTYSNRIHVEDCAGVLKHFVQLFQASELQGDKATAPLCSCFIGVDMEQAPMWDVQAWIAKELGYAENHILASDNSDEASSTESTTARGKRCCNKRLLETGYQFKFPTYREGYHSILRDFTANQNQAVACQ